MELSGIPLMLTGGIATTLLCLALMPLARLWGWIDAPDARKNHQSPTPLVGGTAIFIAFFALALALNGSSMVLVPFAVASTIMLLTGLIDDRWPLGAWVRFAAQAAACGVMIFWADVRLTDFGQLFGPFTLFLGPLAVPLTVFSVLGVINAFNMIDGLDGLSGSVFCVAAGGMAFLAALGGRNSEAMALLLMVGCVGGFLLLNGRLPWNQRARTFLGDSGSVLLGFWLAWAFVDLGNGSRAGGERIFSPMTAVWLIGIPLLDTTRLMKQRWKAGRSAFDADRNHLHHALLDSGCSVSRTWMSVVGLCLLFAAIGIALELSGVPDFISFYAFIAAGLVYFRALQGRNPTRLSTNDY